MKKVFRGEILNEITSILSDEAIEREPVAFLSVLVMKQADGRCVPTVTSMYNDPLVLRLAVRTLEKLFDGGVGPYSQASLEKKPWIEGVPKNDSERNSKAYMILDHIDTEICTRGIAMETFHLFDSPGCFVFRWVYDNVERKRIICASLDKSVDDAVEWVMERLRAI